MEESGGTPPFTWLNPCVLVQEAVKAMLSCLGLVETAPDHPASSPLKPQDYSPPPASTAQASDPPSSATPGLDPTSPVEADDPPATGEMEDNPATFVESAVTKPPINTGTGPQTN
ncbi:lysine-rich arabinogalactan protein 19-like [Rhodamnia argentea]|uniref:Lysine-rich arabinogalactan protein 19-like n=1 Tax=Rhodamnia argentea TaxID=178133 RepID=A0A8B8NT92_9MYRT|nr:lysine-rich arabinogalactan protein 19-like [Rhodamnia argentea]